MSPLRVAVDASSAALGGGMTYLVNILPELARHERISLVGVLAREGAISTLSRSGFSADLVPVLVARTRLSARDRTWVHLANGADVVLVPTEISPVGYRRPVVLGLRNPVTAEPRLVRRSAPVFRCKAQALHVAAKALQFRATRFFAVSNSAAQQGAAALGISRSIIDVVYHGGPDHDYQQSTESRSVRTFLIVSDLYSYKNVEVVIEAAKEMHGEWHVLVVGGFVDRTYAERLKAAAAHPAVRGHFTFLGRVSGSKLDDVYRSADCFLWPSYAETFGHPLVEAHALGLPILAADAASNREVAGAAAQYFFPTDHLMLRELMQSAVTNGLRCGPLPRRYSWSLSAEQLVSTLRRAAE